MTGIDKKNVAKKNPALPTKRESLTELPSKET